MSRSRKFFSIAVMALTLAFVAIPAFAQDSDTGSAPFPANTISVTGHGTVHAAPDTASVDVGVDVTQPTVSDAFAQANTTIQQIIDALTNLGISLDDIQTSNLSVYSTSNYNPQTGENDNGYTVSNTVHVIVRDTTQVEAVINAAIDAGATNLYGLNFDIEDRSALESQARDLAMQDAQTRAQEYATLIGAQLGDVIVVVETQYGSVLPYTTANVRLQSGGGGAVVAAGQTDVQIQVDVTYRISR